ncbi:MAG: hypothetical protein JWN66_2000 [Sphingomonas bacterium]|uniref:DUF4019 domain-containing protein n=1 Tax=Sphingomonas bacterium TaxID=1895847 RepID=UPI0026203D40|nr:DUF4019 domain-containing protein [Sphingomonas bacterium]MDB5704884.1 hypothetical protein [Sphingomonas bacterium]
MRKLLAAALLFGLGGCSMGADLPVADQAVTRFHKMLDAGQNAQIYQESASEMKNAAPEAKLSALLAAVHRKLGTVTKATRQGFNDQMNTGGHYITMTYATSYTRGDAVETFVYKISDGKAALVGYNINSDALIVN